MSSTVLSASEIARYGRHLVMPEVGVEGQARLKAARVLCVGAGGLGSPALLYLAAAGVGTIGIIDFDQVDESNLQRQILYGVPDVGRSKIAVAEERLVSLNPHVTIERHDDSLSAQNALALVRAHDLVIDGTDNFGTRYLVNDACVLVGRPNAYGSIFRFEGQASVFATPGGPCYRCLHPEPPPAGLIPNCAEGGVLGVLPGIVGTIQATEAIKLILGVGEPLIGRLLLYDALRMRFREISLPRDPDCPVCGDHPTIRELVVYEHLCASSLSTTPPESTTMTNELSVEELKARLDRGEPLQLVDVREPNELQICRIEGAIPIPLGQLEARLDEIARDRDVVVFCKMGGRSARGVTLLRTRGYPRAINLKGGILEWIARIDPTQPRY